MSVKPKSAGPGPSNPLMKKELGLETFLFPIFFFGIFILFSWKMGLSNALSTMLKTAEELLNSAGFFA